MHDIFYHNRSTRFYTICAENMYLHAVKKVLKNLYDYGSKSNFTDIEQK